MDIPRSYAHCSTTEPVPSRLILKEALHSDMHSEVLELTHILVIGVAKVKAYGFWGTEVCFQWGSMDYAAEDSFTDIYVTE